MAALEVVLPTPPLPEVTTKILAKVIHPKNMEVGSFSRAGVEVPVGLEKFAEVSVKGG